MLDEMPDDEDQVTGTRVMLIGLAAQLSPMMEAVAGHREDALRRGFSEQAAELMAVSYHSMLLQTMMSGGPRRRSN